MTDRFVQLLLAFVLFHILLGQMGLIVNAAILGGIAAIFTNIGGAQGIFRNKMEAMAGLVPMFEHFVVAVVARSAVFL